MKKNCFIGLSCFIAFASIVGFISPVTGVEKQADASARLANERSDAHSQKKESIIRIKKMVITKVLRERHSPLTGSADAFVNSAFRYDIDPYLLPSISWLESSLAKRYIYGTYNPFGYGGGKIGWNSFEEGIDVVAKALSERYYGRGAKTIYDIGRLYATSPSWAFRVEKFMNHFYNEEKKIQEMQTVLDDSERT